MPTVSIASRPLSSAHSVDEESVGMGMADVTTEVMTGETTASQTSDIAVASRVACHHVQAAGRQSSGCRARRRFRARIRGREDGHRADGLQLHPLE